MISIIKATTLDAPLFVKIGQQSFIESHGTSASEIDLKNYINQNLSLSCFEKELSEPTNIYHLIYYNKKAVGYSKIILNIPNEKINEQNITKLERIYILKDFYEFKLGLPLFLFNLDLSKANNQKGIWLNVWTENKRAINFYTKQGFEIIGDYNFKLSETHSNPNHQMFLKY